MGEKGFLVDAVAQFVQSSTWLDAVSHFLETHYKRFLTDSDRGAKEEGKVATYTLEQYDSFVAFKERVERLLEGVVAELGCSGEDLVEALEDSVRHETSLTTERRFFIQTLLTFEDYDAFYTRISEYAAEKKANGHDGSREGNAEISEWALHEAIARSILEAKAQGQLDETEESLVPWAEALIAMCEREQTSASMETSNVASPNAHSASEAKGGHEERDTKDEKGDEDNEENGQMQQLEKVLIRERFKVDLLVAQRIADANSQLKQQMLNLVAEELDQDEQQESSSSSGNAAEDELAGLFTRVETIRERLKDVKSRCFKFKNVTQPQMDNIYLYLKEKVHRQQDLVPQEKEIAAFIFTHIQESDEALIPLMLEWLLLESEQLRTQNQIQDHLNGARDDSYWVQEWDEDSQAYYYVNSVSRESVWEAPACGYYDTNNDYRVPGEDNPEAAESGSAPTAWTEGEGSLDADALCESFDPESKAMSGSNKEMLATEDAKAGEAVPTLEQASSQLDATFELTIGQNGSEMVRMRPGAVLEMESVLERISREHDEERKRLELVFQLEKARQKEELRKRKERKRREKLAKKKRKEEEEASAKGGEDDAAVLPLPAPMTPRAAVKAEAKDDRSPLSIMVPGRGRIDLTKLLSDSHAQRHRQKNGIDASHEHAMLNPATLRYLTEKMAKKQPAVLGKLVTDKEIVLEEDAADEK